MQPLMDAFRAAPPERGSIGGLRWLAATALLAAAEKKDIPELIDLLEDGRYGEDRKLIAGVLQRRFKKAPEAAAALDAFTREVIERNESDEHERKRRSDDG